MGHGMINTLYRQVAEHFNITVKELKRQLTEEGKPLVHLYYIQKYKEESP
jgi:hypothetical protein